MKRRFTILSAALALLVSLAIPMGMWGQTGTETTTTYTFSSKSWAASPANWTSGKDGNQFTSGRGVQVTTGASGANATSPMSFTNISKVEVTYSTNASTGAGSISIQVGSNIAKSQNVTKTGGTTDRVLTYNYSTMETGNVKLTVTCTTNSIYVKSIAITTSTGGGTSTCATPTFSPVGGNYYTAQSVTISTTTDGATIRYTLDGSTPTASSSVYGTPLSISTNTTVKAIAMKEGFENSSVAEATYNFLTPSFNQDWEGATNGWTFVSVTGEQVWSVASYQGNHYAKMSGYSGSNYANEDWCISPAFNLGDYTNPVLTFTTARSQHNGNELEVYFSNNYNGDPTAATWTQLTCTLPAQPSSGYSDFTSSGNISLSSYSGSNCYIGFKYTSTTSAAATWELDDIVLASQSTTPTITLTPSSIDLGNNNATDVQISKAFTVSQSNLTEGVVLSASKGTLSATTIAQGAEATEVIWTYTPTEAGSINATITATSAGAETQTLTITGAAVAPVTGDRYEMVTEAPQDWSGCYIITGINSGTYYALTGVTSNLGTTAAVTVVGSSIESNSITDGYQVIVAQTTNGYSLFMDGVGYLGYDSDATSGSNNLHALESFAANTCEWTIAMTADGLATITNVRNNGRTLQFNYNSGNSRFACYTSNQVKPTLFKYTGTVVLPPVINVTNNTVSLEYDATEGYVAYTIDNPVAGTNLAATSEADWISGISVASDKVNFTTTVNEGNSDRTATITLSYAGATDKVITVTQGHYVAPFEGGTYTLATSVESGKTYIIVNQESSKAMGTQNDNNRAAVDVVIANEKITVSSDEVYEFVITSVGEGVYSIYDARTSGYLYAASGSKNYLKTETELDDNGKWTISIGENDGVSIVAQGTNGRNNMRFNANNGSPIFSCYASTSELPKVSLYVKDEAPATETYTLTIAGYGNSDGGYYLIASPVTVDPATVTNDENTVSMIDDETAANYDLFYFDQAKEKEWINYKPGEGSTDDGFSLVPGKGYLYAKKATTENQTYTFELTGIPYNNEPIILSKSESGDFPGWNLVGNPFGETAYIGNRSFYVMNEDGSDLVESSGAIAPMKGIFVIAANDGEELQFTKSSTAGKSSRLGLTLSNGRNVIDRATVRFDEGDQLPKFQLNKNHTKVYFSMDGEDYAVVRGEEMGAMPVNFKAENNGTYSLSLSSENVELSYLHLIDNMTGADVDLLQTPSYSFEAKTTDYESRFKLVFATGDNSNDDNFAFYSNGSFVINNEGNAELQVIDIMGRIVKSESINGCANVSVNGAAGVYMLRLVNGDNVKVQKVVVK